VRNSSGTTLGENDDSSGVFSRVLGTVPGDGTLQVQGTWWQNTTWNAATSITPGSFNMALYAVTITTPGVSTQWYRFSGLGGTIQADILNLSAGGDTVMAIFNSSGTMLGFNDDAVGLASSVSVASPNDGVVYIAVSDYNGLSGQGTNAYYDNRITNTDAATWQLRVVPTPGSLALLGLGGLLAGRRRR
jgi:MYXO-CTERM domain-containing protein